MTPPFKADVVGSLLRPEAIFDAREQREKGTIDAAALRKVESAAIADAVVMMFGLKVVQLQDEPSILHQLLILPATMSPAAAQQALIPLAAGFDIRDADERLRAHRSDPNRTLEKVKRERL